ncbi:C2 calcium-dependent domain-containing protein 4C [Xenopus laevis]|uniref:C2 domain-containing protein n=2 Tax=Xenopus laevis TaxID=8355 RepID=A0A974DC43_XENLA|nr:C2 calcium-dependent domain-containing protein 4C [Xenopus laevis]OCT89393.1 hypothetical protein XELAEV_18018014mg [Xenopus laevis]
MMGKKRQTHHYSRCPNVLIPSQIPEFCIPPRHQSQKGPKNNMLLRSDYFGSVFESGRLHLPETHIIQVENMDESTEGENTNADPQSQAALSLPHLKTQTSYGFCTLLESPNTRRKESLFHSDPADLPLQLHRSKSSAISCWAASCSGNYINLRLLPSSVSGTFDSDPVSSTDSSPFSSPLLHRALPNSLVKALSQDSMVSKALRVNCKSFAVRNNSVSTDEDTSADSSPCVTRRPSYDWPQHLSIRSHTGLLVSFSQLAKDSTVTLDTGGILRLSSEYRSESMRLRIRLVSAEGLYKSSVDSKNISCSISITIVPGKNQKQKSTLIRGSRNPIFNEDFFFEGMGPHDLFQKTLKVKALNRSSYVWKDSVLGKSKVNLVSVLPI